MHLWKICIKYLCKISKQEGIKAFIVLCLLHPQAATTHSEAN